MGVVADQRHEAPGDLGWVKLREPFGLSKKRLMPNIFGPDPIDGFLADMVTPRRQFGPRRRNIMSDQKDV